MPDDGRSPRAVIVSVRKRLINLPSTPRSSLASDASENGQDSLKTILVIPFTIAYFGSPSVVRDLADRGSGYGNCGLFIDVHIYGGPKCRHYTHEITHLSTTPPSCAQIQRSLLPHVRRNPANVGQSALPRRLLSSLSTAGFSQTNRLLRGRQLECIDPASPLRPHLFFNMIAAVLLRE